MYQLLAQYRSSRIAAEGPETLSLPQSHVTCEISGTRFEVTRHQEGKKFTVENLTRDQQTDIRRMLRNRKAESSDEMVLHEIAVLLGYHKLIDKVAEQLIETGEGFHERPSDTHRCGIGTLEKLTGDPGLDTHAVSFQSGNKMQRLVVTILPHSSTEVGSLLIEFQADDHDPFGRYSLYDSLIEKMGEPLVYKGKKAHELP